MDFDHPDDEPSRPVTPRPWVELSRFAGELGPGTQEPPPLDGNTYRTWSKRWIVYDSTPGEDEGSPIYVRWTFVWKLQDWHCQGYQRVLSRQDSFDASLDPHAPFPLDASRAALPLPAQLASSRSFGYAPRERGAPTPEDILASRVRSRSPGRPG